MSRSTHVIGLNDWAKRFVAGERMFLFVQTGTRKYPDGRVEKLEEQEVFGSSVLREESGETFEGMYEEEIHVLHKYTFSDGRVYFERVQDDPWSGGPCIFLALQDTKGGWVPESLWDQTVIDDV